MLGIRRVHSQRCGSAEGDLRSLPRHAGLRSPRRPTQGRPTSGLLGVALGPGRGLARPRAGSLDFPRWPEGEWAGGRRRRRPPPPGPPGSSRPEAGDQRPLPRGAPRWTRPRARPPPGTAPTRARPIGERPARASRALYCYANIKEVKGAPARRVGECSGAWGGAWEPQPKGAGTGSARRRRPGPTGPATRPQRLPSSPARRAQLDVAGVPPRRPPAPSAWSAQGRRAGPGGAAPSMRRGAPRDSRGPTPQLQPPSTLSPGPARGPRPEAA